MRYRYSVRWPPPLPPFPSSNNSAELENVKNVHRDLSLFWVKLFQTASKPVAEWLACWTQAQKGPGSNRSRAAVGYNSLKQTVHTHCVSVHQAVKLVAALLMVAGVTAGLAKSNGSLPPGL